MRTSTEAHVCPSCSLPLVQPEDCEPAGRNWRVWLWCPNCPWSGEALLDQEQVDRFEAELDEGIGQLATTLTLVTASNMRDYADRFTAALAADAILPDDF